MVEGREREELLERETVMMGARLAAGEAYRASPSPRVPSTVATAASSSPRTAASPRFGGGSPRINGTQSPASASRLPTRQTRSTPPSPNLSRNGSLLASSTRQQGFSSPITPASKLASAYRARTDSTSSSTSSSLNALEQQQRLADVGSPLMGQTMAFGPKSSFGSSVAASPLKARSNGTSFASKMTAPSSTRFRLPSAPPPATQHAMDTNRLSRLSTASSTDDYGDHLPPPVERDWNPSYSGGSGAGDGGGLQGLREDDERFLADLSVGGEGSGEE